MVGGFDNFILDTRGHITDLGLGYVMRYYKSPIRLSYNFKTSYQAKLISISRIDNFTLNVRGGHITSYSKS
jgi:hypothetical protein